MYDVFSVTHRTFGPLAVSLVFGRRSTARAPINATNRRIRNEGSRSQGNLSNFFADVLISYVRTTRVFSSLALSSIDDRIRRDNSRASQAVRKASTRVPDKIKIRHFISRLIESLSPFPLSRTADPRPRRHPGGRESCDYPRVSLIR